MEDLDGKTNKMGKRYKEASKDDLQRMIQCGLKDLYFK